MGAEFIHLTCKSSFSLLDGMTDMETLAEKVGVAGFPAAGVTDIGNLYGAVEASKFFPKNGVQPLLGCELPVLELPTDHLQTTRPSHGYLTLLVQTDEGWKNLAKLMSLANARKHEGLDAALALSHVLAANAGLIALSGPYGRGWSALGLKQGRVEAYLDPLAKAFGDRFYMQLERHGTKDERATEQTLRQLADTLKTPLVATNDVRFMKPANLAAFEALVCIGDSKTLDDPTRRRFTANHHLRSAEGMLEAFADIPDATANTVEIAKRCAYLLSSVHVKKMFLPKWEFSGDTPPAEVIRTDAVKGLAERLEQHVYPRCADAAARAAAKERYEKQLEFELGVIVSMGYDSYFLITSDFIRWAKRNGIPVGPGRGSGAGSLCAWALQITDLDPLRWDLYFERFLNPDRVSLPDFDIDFCQDRREEVIQYVQQRFGADRVAQIITFGTLKAKACLRDVGRVMGMGYSYVGQIAAFIPEGATPPPIAEVLEKDERLKARYESEDDVKRLIDTALELEGCYRHSSTHAAGVIITDRPIDTVCGLYVDPKSPMPATQLSMYDAEYAGLVKFDFLGLKTLSIVRLAEELAKRINPALNVHMLPLDDKPTFDMLSEGKTVGVFQIEGAGMTDLAKKMKPDGMEALSAMIALYRPGPMDLIPQYLEGRRDPATIRYPHPLLEETLKPTFGIAVYQEQVMQMARIIAGYTLAGADLLRRAMGKKKPEEMAKERVKFVEGAATVNNINADDANRIFDLMETFAGYGFNKAHSMAYGLISYQTAYLKCHYPLEFMAATMTYDRGNTDKLIVYKTELEKMGFALLPVDVNASDVMFSVEPKAVRHALAAVKGAGEEVMGHIVAERKANGPFKNIWDFLARVDPKGMNKRQVEVLIKAGAFDSLDKNRALLLANVDSFMAYANANAEQKASGQGSLFGGDDTGGALDPAPFQSSLLPPLQLDHLQLLGMEQETLGFYMSDHPLAAFEAELARVPNIRRLADLDTYAHNGGGICQIAAIVQDVREVKTKSGGRMGIAIVTDTSGQGEIALFPETYARLYDILHSKTPLIFTTKVSHDGERLRANADAVKSLTDMLSERVELTLTLTDTAQLSPLKSELDKAERGSTRVKLLVPAGGHHAVIRIPNGVRCNPTMMANLKGLGVGIG